MTRPEIGLILIPEGDERNIGGDKIPVLMNKINISAGGT